MNVGSLFTGVGGIDLGLERAGMRIAWQCEIDEWCRRVLAKHWPDVPRYTDVRTIDETTPRVDVLAGGFPCQPVSLAGRRLAQQDERWLWPEFARLVRLLRPRYVLVENVPGLLARGMGDVLGDLAACGYDAEWDCIGAVDVGAPHRRKRVWIVAYPQREPVRGQPGGMGGASRAGEGEGTERERLRLDVVDGGADVADADRAGRGQRRGTVAVRPEHRAAQRCGETLADAQELAERARLREGEPRIFGRRRPGDLDRAGDPWTVEPDVGRVANGIPARVDRLRGLGNAVVPQVVEWIGRRMMEGARGGA